MKTSPSDPPAIRILHLSDVHFGLKKSGGVGGKPAIEMSAHHFVTGAPGSQVPDPCRLVMLLQESLGDGDAEPDILVISGDVGWSGSEQDYEYALQFLEQIREKWPRVQIHVVPGNHDVNLSDGIRDIDRQTAFISFLKKLHGHAYEEMFPLLNWRGASNLSDRERLVSIQAFGDSALMIGVNSAAYINDRSKRGLPIYVSSELLRLITEYIAENKSRYGRCALRIFVMHHHLLPFAEPRLGDAVDYASPPSEPDPTIVANSAQLQSWLSRNGFDLVLHGHKHMPHGRSDRLWRRVQTEDSPRHTFVVGAGTAGVSQNEIPRNEGLSLNRIRIARIDQARWAVGVRVLGLFPDEPGSSVKDLFSYSDEIGVEPKGRPLSFISERMDFCHQAIAERCRTEPVLRNFVSVVTKPEFVLPAKTARIGDDEVTPQQIENCFRVLHPEFERDAGYGWGNSDVVQARLQNVPKRFAFQHGPRIFGVPGRVRAGAPAPADKALQALDLSDTRGYLSLINTEMDLLGGGERQPMPGLVGIQFLRNGKQLDLTATFRSLELSFWWVVNMYEACLLLKWASQRRNLAPGAITIFSPFAEWRANPQPSFPTGLDEISISDLANLAV